MAVRIVARLAQDEVTTLLGELLPMTIDLGGDEGEAGERWIQIEKAHHVDFVVSEGLRVHTTALVQWKAAGVRLRGTLQNLELTIRPLIAADQRGRILLFKPSVEKIDFKHVPAFVDRHIANRINQAVEAEGDRLAWHFDESIAARVPMPRNMAPVDALDLKGGEATVEVFDDALVLSMSIETHFTRGTPGTAPEEETADSDPGAASVGPGDGPAD